MNGVLIVDDDQVYREYLINDLRKNKNYEVVEGAASGEEAVKIMTSRPQAFRFAVIDHLLENGMDGIETTRELVNICPSLYPVVFSNVPADTKLMEYKFKALEAGAFRYLEKMDDRPRQIQISEFVKEMEQLEHLRNWVASFHEARTSAPSLLTQLDIGMDIIDRQNKVWFMNDAQRRMTGFTRPGLPMAPCAQWHGMTFCPCEGCIVDQTFKDGKSKSSVFLSHFTHRKDRELFYLRVWSQVVNDPILPLGSDGKPVTLAVMESVLDLTDTDELKAMPLDERLTIIAKAVGGIRARPYSCEGLFEYVRIYVADGGTGQFLLRAAAGTKQPSQLGLPVNLRAADGQRLADAEGHMKSSGFGYWFEKVDGFDPAVPGDKRIPFIYWPFIQDNTTIALLEVGGRLIREKTAEIVLPYAKEVLQAIKDDRERTPLSLANAKAEKCVGEVDLALQTKTKPQSPEDQLKEIVRRACELTGSHQYILRYREGDNARLLRLDVTEYNAYEAVAPVSYPLSHAESISCRTVMAGTETLTNTADQNDSINFSRRKMDKHQKQVLENVNSLCCEPLILEGLCIGSMCFHARTVKNYDEKKRAILRLLAKRAAWALQDYLMARTIRDRAEAEAQAQVLSVVLHNIKTPLATIGIDFFLLIEAFNKKYRQTDEMVDLVKRIKEGLSKISHLQEAVLKLRKPLENRIKATQLHELLQKVVTGRLGRNAIQSDFKLEASLQEVFIDTAAVEVCLEILVDNAIDAMKDTNKKTIQIVLREADPTKIGKLAIDVIDNGSGVSADIAERLFTTMQIGKVQGAGIGLLHGRAIATAARGDIVFDPKHSPGAKFTLILPYTKKGT